MSGFVVLCGTKVKEPRSVFSIVVYDALYKLTWTSVTKKERKEGV